MVNVDNSTVLIVIIWSPGQNMSLKALVYGAYFIKIILISLGSHTKVVNWAEDSPLHFPEASDKITGKWLQVSD